MRGEAGASEMKALLSKSENDEVNFFSLVFSPTKFPMKLSLTWRLVHSILYNIGGFTFLVGSICYFPKYSNYLLGGWLFTIGSAGFLMADLLEWYTNNRVGCFDNESLRKDFEEEVGVHMESKDSCFGSYQRAENGMNFFFSAFGSTLYLIGSILFIPSLDEIVLGTEVFIAGSIVIFLSQSWKIYRQGSSNEAEPSNKSFAFTNYLADLPALFVDSFAGIGGFFYLIGSVYFLPEYDLDDEDTIRAAALFTVGGASFTFSALSIIYRYFITHPPMYPH